MIVAGHEPEIEDIAMRVTGRNTADIVDDRAGSGRGGRPRRGRSQPGQPDTYYVYSRQ